MRFIYLSLVLIVMSTQSFALTDADKGEVKAIVAQYIKENPDEVLDAVLAAQDAIDAKAAAASQEKISDLLVRLEEINAPQAGNPDGDVTVVEFFDYNCGYCKRTFGNVNSILKSDSNIRVLFVETPILGRSSLLAAKWSLAAENQDKYFEFHSAVMKNKGRITETTLENSAKKVGMDVEKAREDASSPATSKKIKSFLDIAQDIGVKGTPAFVIDGKLYPGMLSIAELKQEIKKSR